jgi:hypothetical protein
MPCGIGGRVGVSGRHHRQGITPGVIMGSGIVSRVAFGGNEIDVSIEGELAFFPEPGGRADQQGQIGKDFGRKARAVFLEQLADVVPLRRLDADLPKDSFQQVEHFETKARLDQVALGEGGVRHISNSSPGR